MFDIERDYLTARRLDLAGETARFEALLAIGPDRALEAFRVARDRADLAAALAGGALLFDHGLLAGSDLATYARALDAEGRHGDAVPVWRAAIAAQPDIAAFHVDLAEALAAAAEIPSSVRFSLALKAAKQAQRLQLEFTKARTLARQLRWIPRAEAMPPGWARVAAVLERYEAVGAHDASLRELARLHANPPPGAPDEADAQRIVDVGLDRDRPKAVKAAFQFLVQGEPRTDAQKTALIRMTGRLGSPHEAARKAMRFLPPWEDDEGLDKAATLARRRLRYFAAEALAEDGRFGRAIAQLGALVTSDGRDFAARTALQRCTGDQVLRAVTPKAGEGFWDAPRPPKIFNLLPFYNERTLMEMRLAEMGGWVDHFVVVEATQTFTGKAKPLHFAAVREGLAAHRDDQFLSVAVEAFPKGCDTAWAREFYQRDMAVKALVGRLRPDDIVLITDADEIVDRRALDGYWPHLANLRMITSKYFLNYQSHGINHANRRSGVICRGEHLARFGSTYLRTALSAGRKAWESAPAAGWHFTSMGEAQAIAEKFAAYAHQEASKAQLTGVSEINAQLAAVRAGAQEPGWRRVPVDERFPRFVRENQAMLAGLLLDA